MLDWVTKIWVCNRKCNSSFCIIDHQILDQLGNYTVNEVKFDLEPYPSTPQYSTVPMQVSYSPTNFAFHPNNTQFDVNNNNHNYVSDQLNTNHTLTSAPIGTIQQQNLGSSPNQSVHMPLTARYSIGNGSPNVLMLPPNHSSRGGGSLPDLRSGNYNQYQAQSFSTISTPGAGPFNTTQGFFNAPLPQQTAEVELLNLVHWVPIHLVLTYKQQKFTFEFIHLFFRHHNDSFHRALDLWNRAQLCDADTVRSVISNQHHRVEEILLPRMFHQ